MTFLDRLHARLGDFRWYSMWLIATSVLVFLVHLTTIENYPPNWYDEICMIEWGRFSFYDILPRWGVDMWADPNGLHPPYPLFHYLSGLIYEGLYRLSSHFLAARIWALSSIMFLPVLLFRWLTTTHRAPCLFAFLISALALVDPNITICAHWYRPDIWSICIFLAASAVLDKLQRPTVAAAFIGFMIAVNTAFWITSVLFAPLYLFEYCQFARRRGLKLQDIWLKSGLACCTGGIVAIALILAPQLKVLPMMIDQYANRSELGSMGKSAAALGLIPARIFDFVKIAARSPFCWALATLGFFGSNKRTFFKLVLSGLIALMLATNVYHLRMIYLVPFLYALVPPAVTSLATRFGKRHTVTALVFAFACSFAISCPLLNFAAQARANTFDTFKNMLNTALGTVKGNIYILDFEHECYFALRETGRSPISGLNKNLIFDYEKSAHLIDSIDGIVVAKAMPITPEQLAFITSRGFAKTAEFDLPQDTSPGILQHVRTAIYAHGYPGCTIYTRQPPTRSASIFPIE